MSLTIITGPMYAGKTKKLVDEIVKYIDVCPVKCLIINSVLDIRDDFISSHHSNFIVPPNCDVIKLSRLEQANIDEYFIIGIDEAQFFPDLYNNVLEWVEKGKHVFCAGLSSDFKMKPFPELEKLYSKADQRINLHAVCMECIRENPNPSPISLNSMKAFFSKRVSNEKDLISVEAQYIPVCQKHMETF